MSDLAVSLQGVRKRYRFFAIDGLDLDLAAGRTLGLVGQNGAGKSTLLRILMGLVRADAGRVVVLGREMPAQEREIKARTGFVSEDMALYGSATLRWHMDFVRSIYGAWDERRAAALAERFELRPQQKIRGMSRGQQVKAMLLLALARRPELLVLDEPTAGLDPLVRQDVLREIEAARDGRCTVIFSSHRGEDVVALADEVAFVHGGRIVARGSTPELLREGRSLDDLFLQYVRRIGEGRVA